MKVVDVAQRSPEWFAWRKGGITASEAAVILGSGGKTWWRLWAEKTGLAEPEDLSRNPHVQRGITLEPAARAALEEQLGDILLPVCVESDCGLFRASLDGITADGRPTELKCPSEGVFQDVIDNGLASEAVRRYLPQVQHQMLVTEASSAWLGFFFEGTIKAFEIERDQGTIDQLVEAGRRFWDHMQTGKQPDLDPARDIFVPSGETLSPWLSAAAAWLSGDAQQAALEAQLAAVKKKKDQAQGLLVGLMGEFLLADGYGVRVSRYLQKGAVDYPALLKELLPDLSAQALDEFRKAPGQRVRLTATGGAVTQAQENVDQKPEHESTDFWF